jgi:hypothetical protein
VFTLVLLSMSAKHDLALLFLLDFLFFNGVEALSTSHLGLSRLDYPSNTHQDEVSVALLGYPCECSQF